MQRFAPYAGIVSGLLVGVLIVVFLGVPARFTSPQSAAIPAPAVVSQATTESTTTAPVLAATSSAPSAPAKAVAKQTAPSPVVVAPPTTAVDEAALEASATALRAALVNILCYAPSGSGLHSISGSGVFIDPKGYILTNAHIGQYFLLHDRGVSCTIRAGSPAKEAYTATLAFVSPAWIHENAALIVQAAPSGNGEHDLAVLAVTGSETNTTLPTSFPSVPLATVPPSKGTPVAIATYGAQFLESAQVESSLFPTVVFGSIKDVFTFGRTTVDVLALGGSAAAQEGSSGGGVAGQSGALVGTITTSTVTGDTATRSLNAISASYIRADYASETGEPLDLLLTRSPDTATEAFAPQATALELLLTAAIDAH